MNRRVLLAGAVGLTAGLLGWRLRRAPVTAADERQFEITRSDEEWRQRLTRAQYDVLRRHGTERAYTSPLNGEKRPGIYACAGCELDLFASEAKYDSGTGWPSFHSPLANAVGTAKDYQLLLPRTEVHCRRCGGHLGHVFPDGPPPTGLRYCINGVALIFKPRAAA